MQRKIQKILLKNNAYRHRFFLFKYLKFPRYQEYDEYDQLYSKVFEDSTDESVETMRTHFKEGLKWLNNIKSTEEGLRNLKSLPKETIDNLSMLSAKNSFAYFMGNNAKEGQKVKVNLDVTASKWLPAINISITDA